MNQQELLGFMKSDFEKKIALAEKKNGDYADAKEQGADAFKNLNMCELFDVCKCETGIFVRLTDKFSRLSTFLKRGKLQNESVEDTLDDIIVYAVLMKARIASRGVPAQ